MLRIPDQLIDVVCGARARNQEKLYKNTTAKIRKNEDSIAMFQKKDSKSYGIDWVFQKKPSPFERRKKL